MLNYKSLSEKQALIISGDLDLIENVSYFIEQINLHSDINAFNLVLNDDALKAAEIVQEKIISGTGGALAGLVIAIKDNIALKSQPLTCSSKILSEFTSLYDATVVQKLKDADAIIIGKTNCDEFAMGSSNENSSFGKVLNPHDKSRVPGGSSGGSAAAVAAGLCDAALGSDTGGSIRQPAAFCGVYGLKPTYSLVSRYGLTAFASSLDSIGPISNNLEDCKKILDVISGFDANDGTSSKQTVNNSDSTISVVGIPKEYFSDGLSAEIKAEILNKISALKSSGVEVKEVSLPSLKYSIATYYIISTAEASANLSRYDGARYGFRAKNSNNLSAMYSNSRSEGFGAEVKRRIMLGTYVLSSGYYDAYYKKAQKVRALIWNEFKSCFTGENKVDALIVPTTPTTAFKIGEKSNDPVQMYLSDIYTTSINLAGLPAINIPIGYDKENLPIGLQVIADHFCENKIFATGKLLV